MEHRQGLTAVDAQEIEEIARDAEIRGHTVYRISTAGQPTRAGFFDAVRESLPLDPPLVGARSWEALSDSLWEGLFVGGPQDPVIIWADAGLLKENDPATYEVAVAVLGEVAEQLADPAITQGRPRQVRIIIGK